ncbi:MAG: MATE family efflux transporter, partial [Spirochaetaceae bacterium]|nr:MATE family efflux transporter [Spirochaetaceae bacterium]
LACVTLAVANLAVKPYKGDTGLAVIGIITTLIQFLGFPLFGIISGAQPLWGYNFGAGKWTRVRKISFLTLIWTVAFASASEAAMLLFPGFFVGLFSADPALAALGIRSLRIFACAFALFPLELLAVSYFQSTNRAFPAAVAMLIRSLSFIIGMIVLPIFIGYDGVLWAGPVSDVLTAALGLVYSLKMRNEIRRACREEEAAAIA